MNEPNDSSRSSGVTLLDEYIHKNYQYTQTFGRMSIWQRIPAPITSVSEHIDLPERFRSFGVDRE